MTQIVKLPLLDGGDVCVNPRRVLIVAHVGKDWSKLRMNIPDLEYDRALPAHKVAQLLTDA